MKRTYTTIFEIAATSKEEAEALYNELGDTRYTEELEQMDVEEDVAITKVSYNAPKEHFAYLVD